MDTKRDGGLPSGYTESIQSKTTYQIGPHNLPWVKKPERVSLALVSVQGGVKFFLGSAVRGSKLTQAADALDEKRTRIAHNLLYARLPAFVENGSGASKLDDPITQLPIFYFSNNGGQRVYLIRPPDIEVTEWFKKTRIPCVVKIAVCDKNMEEAVLSVISTQDLREVKRTQRI